MSIIEANVKIDLPDGMNPRDLINMIRQVVSGLNGKETRINVVEVDNPMSLSPIQPGFDKTQFSE